MNLEIVGRHIEITPAMRDFAFDKLRKLEKLLDGPLEVHLVLLVEKHRQLAEIQVKTRTAVLSGAEAETSAELLSLVLAQYWSMRSYDHVLDHELSQAQEQLEELPKYFEFWRMPGRYHDFSNEAIDFAKDKITITQSMHTLLGSESQIESDWALRELYEEAGAAFGVQVLVGRVETKLARIEAAYNVAREQLSANFYILLDIIFLAFLVWSIFDTLLLARIAFRG